VNLLFRVKHKLPEGWNPLTGREFASFSAYNTDDGVQVISRLRPNQSVFFIFRNKLERASLKPPEPLRYTDSISLSQGWTVEFDKNYGGPASPVVFNELISWSQHTDPSVKYYSGTAIYKKTFTINKQEEPFVALLSFDSVNDIATVKVNGIVCDTIWTCPYVAIITNGIKQGENTIEIAVTNTWHNRLFGDNLLPPEKRTTWTTAPFRLKDKPLLPAGIIGNIVLKIR